MTDRVGQRDTNGFAVVTLLMVALFVGLGVWQLQRRVEEHALIASPQRLCHCPIPRSGPP
jgi:cytochrome oxidase assembly protein ShyY1